MNTEELHNEDAENNILGIMMIDNTKIASISSLLDTKDFFTEPKRLLFETICTMYKNGKPVDIVSVSEQLKFDNHLDTIGGREYINLLADGVITITNYKQLCKIIRKYSKKRQLLYTLDKVKENINKGQDIDDAIKDTEAQLRIISLDKSNNNLNNILSGIDNVINEINTVMTSSTNTFGLSTGLKGIDNILSGLCKGKLYILAARPMVGKSALAQQIAENISKDNNVLYHSLEMTVDQYTKRSIYRLTGLNNDVLMNNQVALDTALTKAAQASEQLSQLKLYIDDNYNCNLTSIEANINRMITDKGSCDLVIIDYLQLMTPENKNMYDKFEIVSHNSTGLKRLAMKYNIPILCLSQLSRQVEQRQDKRPLLSDLRESGSIEQDADVVMFIYREAIYNPTPLNKYNAEVIVAKNREGSTRIIPMLFNGSKTEFKDIK